MHGLAIVASVDTRSLAHILGFTRFSQEPPPELMPVLTKFATFVRNEGIGLLALFKERGKAEGPIRLNGAE